MLSEKILKYNKPSYKNLIDLSLLIEMEPIPNTDKVTKNLILDWFPT